MSRWLSLFALVFAFGCGGGEEPSTIAGGSPAAEPPAAEEPPPEAGPAGDPELDAVVALAKKVRANPDAAAAILAEAGYTVDGFSELLVEIASDPARSEAYAAGLQ